MGEVPSEHTVFDRATANRLVIADVLDGLDDAQWRSPSLCAGWDVHTVAAHLLQPFLVGFGRFFLTALRYRGDTDRVVDHVTRRLARRSRPEIVAALRSHAADRVAPPRVGPIGPFAETCIHLRDIARPLGLSADVPVEDWTTLLDHLTGPRPVASLVTPGRVEGLRLVATDADWSSGDGAEVTGRGEALGMAVSGRRAALQDLDGPGVRILDTRLGT